jgi:hypothetical protein
MFEFQKYSNFEMINIRSDFKKFRKTWKLKKFRINWRKTGKHTLTSQIGRPRNNIPCAEPRIAPAVSGE